MYVHNWFAAETITLSVVMAILLAMIFIVGPATERLADWIHTQRCEECKTR